MPEQLWRTDQKTTELSNLYSGEKHCREISDCIHYTTEIKLFQCTHFYTLQVIEGSHTRLLPLIWELLAKLTGTDGPGT